MLFILFLTALIIYFVKIYSNLVYYGSKLPGPQALPIIGNGLLFQGKTPSGT